VSLSKEPNATVLKKEPNATFEVYGQEVAFGANSSISSKTRMFNTNLEVSTKTRESPNFILHY
jgi:hypothetical protein